MPEFGRFNIFRRRTKDAPKDTREARPSAPLTEEDLKLSAELDAALEEAQKTEANAREENEALLIEQAELRNPRVAWALIERVFKNRKELGETEIMDAKQFRRKKGSVYFGAVKDPERKTFSDPIISRDILSVAAQEIEEGLRESKESLRAQYMHERQKQRADVVEHLMADMAHYIFGDNVEVKLTDETDDRGGIDCAVIFKDKNGRVEQVFGLDFTTAYEQPVIDKKIARSLRGVTRGYLNTIHYLRTKDLQGRDEYFSSRFVPRGTIGVSNMSALLFAKRWEQSGKSGAPDIIGSERRASMLYALLEEYRGQRMCSQMLDKEKRLNQPSDATQELLRAEARIQSIIKENHLEWPGQKQHKDRTLERIRETVKSTGKGGKMPELLRRAQEDVKKLDALKGPQNA